MSKELEALSLLVETSIYGNKNDNRGHIFEAEEIIKKALTPPTAEELVTELNKGFKVEHYVSGEWWFDGENIKTKLYYEDGSFLTLHLDELAIKEFIKNPKIFKMVARYYGCKINNE